MRKGSLTKLIDADRRFKVSKRLSMLSSAILIIHQLADVQVNEINLLLTKLVLKNQEIMPSLLMILTSGLLVLYFINTRRYHEKLYKQWTHNMITRRPFWYVNNPYESEIMGLVYELIPKGIIYEQIMYEHGRFDFEYVCKPFFRRAIRYQWSDQFDSYDEDVAVHEAGLTSLLRAYWFELKNQVSILFSHPEYLEIYVPYVIGFAALLSYFNPDLVTEVLTII